MGMRGTISAKVCGELNTHLNLYRRALKRGQFKAADTHHKIIVILTRGQTVCYNGYDTNWEDGKALAVITGGVKSEKYAA